MHIPLFRALQGIRIAPDEAERVVDSLDAHVESMANNHIRAVEGRLNGIQASIDTMKTQMQFIGVMLAIIGLANVAGPLIAKLIR